MNRIMDIVSGMGILIAIFLFLSRGNETVKIITSIASGTRGMVQTLQGR